MARVALRHRDNAPGDWFVDERCIDCGTCREVAPELFASIGDQSVVARQPEPSPTGRRPAGRAAVSDLTEPGWRPRRARRSRSARSTASPARAGSTRGGAGRERRVRLRLLLAGLVRRHVVVRRPAGGNVLVDSPRYTAALAEPFEAMGGIDHVVLTHRDDVADAERWAEHFGSRVWIHADDAGAAPFATDRVDGLDEVAVTARAAGHPGAGPHPGQHGLPARRPRPVHRRLAGLEPRAADLIAFRDACWYSWPAQADSLERLADRHRFASVLPGPRRPHRGRPRRRSTTAWSLSSPACAR